MLNYLNGKKMIQDIVIYRNIKLKINNYENK